MTTDSPLRVALYLRESKSDTGSEVRSQDRAGRQWVTANGHEIPTGAVYIDDDRSASAYATRAREEFARLVMDIEAGRLDLVWFWSLSRSQRRLDQYVQLRDLCRKRGVNWVINRRVYDLNNPMDLQSLGISAVNDEVFSHQLSHNVRRGLGEAAIMGKPHGPTTYGYQRIYEDREYVTQVPHPETGPVVYEIITRIANGEPVARIARELTERGVPAPGGGSRWHRATIGSIAANRAYVGDRVTNGEVAARDAWQAIVERDVFEAAQVILSDPKRMKTKPGRAIHLLSYIARCKCGEAMQVVPDRWGPKYRCIRRDSSVPVAALDDFITRLVNAYLSRPDVAEALSAASVDNPEAIRARARVAALQVEIANLETALDQGDPDMDAIDIVRALKGKRRALDVATSESDLSAVPAILRKAVEWSDVPVARQVISSLIEITVHPVGKGRGSRSGGVPAHERVGIRWLIGPDAR